MAVLGLVESTLSFAVIYTVVQATGASVPRTVVIEMPLDRAFATAALLTVIGGFVALIIGLYRPEVCLDRKRLLIASAFAAIIAFTLLLLVDNGPRSSLTSGHALYLAKVIATWLASITLVRLTYALAVNRMSLGRRVLLLGDPRQVGALSVRLRSYASRPERFLAVATPVAHLGHRRRKRTPSPGRRTVGGLQAPRRPYPERRGFPGKLSRPDRS
jgi:uncharacterized membrane protein YiaA